MWDLEMDRLKNRAQCIGVFQQIDNQSLFGSNCPHMRIKGVPDVNPSEIVLPAGLLDYGALLRIGKPERPIHHEPCLSLRSDLPCPAGMLGFKPLLRAKPRELVSELTKIEHLLNPPIR
jgi:hypothetical protein